MIIPTLKSLQLTEYISSRIDNLTFHHHYHTLYDIESTEPTIYMEIGCYAGGSAILMLQRPNTTVISIDIGHPITKDAVLKNILDNNPLNNRFNYIEGNSHDHQTLDSVKRLTDNVDILFIDGDHSYSSVIKDFEMYSSLVKKNGYIVFDDYRDSVHSPDVKNAVDFIVDKNSKDYNIIGTIPNIFGARPSTLVDGNCFFIEKK